MVHTWWAWYNAPIEGTEGISPRRILDTIPDPKEEVYRDMLPHSNINFGLEGQPVYWEKTGDISSNFSEISKLLTLDDLVIRHIRQQEMAVRRMQYYSETSGKPSEAQIIVFDLANLSYAIDTTAMAAFRKTLQIDQDFYPERLHTLFMINAPWFFTAIWAVISPWLDPVTANKIRIVGSNYISSLREVIADDQIPKELGGSFEGMTWQWPFPEDSGCSEATLSMPLLNEVKYSSAMSKGGELDKGADVATSTP